MDYRPSVPRAQQRLHLGAVPDGTSAITVQPSIAVRAGGFGCARKGEAVGIAHTGCGECGDEDLRGYEWVRLGAVVGTVTQGCRVGRSCRWRWENEVRAPDIQEAAEGSAVSRQRCMIREMQPVRE